MSQETACWQSQRLLGRGAWAQEHCLEAWRLVSLGCLSSHPDSQRFLAVHMSLSQGGLQQGGLWEVVGPVGWCLLSPSDLSQIISFGGNSLVPCSLPGLAAVRELSQVVSILPGQDGWFQSVFPNTPPVSPPVLGDQGCLPPGGPHLLHSLADGFFSTAPPGRPRRGARGETLS